MDTRFFITTSKHIPGAGYRPIMLGYPEQMKMANDICLCAKGSTDYIPLNSFMLKEALLSSKELLQAMGLEVTVKNETPATQKKTEVEKVVVKPAPTKRAPLIPKITTINPEV